MIGDLDRDLDRPLSVVFFFGLPVTVLVELPSVALLLSALAWRVNNGRLIVFSLSYGQRIQGLPQRQLVEVMFFSNKPWPQLLLL